MMTETRYILDPADVPALKAWLDSAKLSSGGKRWTHTAFRSHDDAAWVPEHLSLRTAVLRVERDTWGDESGWTFSEHIYPQAHCEGYGTHEDQHEHDHGPEEHLSAKFQNRAAADAFLATYVPLFHWDTQADTFQRGPLTLSLEETTLPDGHSVFALDLAAEDKATLRSAVSELPVPVKPLHTSFAWHLWKLTMA